jgi:hypothetical protein
MDWFSRIYSYILRFGGCLYGCVPVVCQSDDDVIGKCKERDF